MPTVDPEFAPLRDPRLAALATGAWPVWLWSTDGSRILWANAVGAAIFGAVSVGALGQRRFKSSDIAAAQVIRLGATLPSRAQERLERLRGFGAGFGRALTCVCSRVVLDDGRAGVLIVAGEAAGPTLTLGERVRRLFADGNDAIAAFGADGTLVHANAATCARLAGATTLSALSLAGFAAPETGSVQTNANIGGATTSVTVERLGKDNGRVLLLTLAPPPAGTPPAQSVAETTATLRQTVEPAFSAAIAPAIVAAPPIEPAAEPISVSPGAAEEPAAAPAPTAAIEAPIAEEAVSAPAARQDTAARQDAPFIERRHPLRFVWHMDADERFVVGSDEFITLVGPRTMAAVDRPWGEIADELNLDPDNQVASAVASQETWSGLVVSWPVDDSTQRLPVELSGLPVFDRDRVFRGYRGFGVCRDIDCINEVARERREGPADVLPAPQAPAPSVEAAVEAATEAATEALAAPAVMAKADEIAATDQSEPAEPESTGVAPGAANVVPFRQSQASESRTDTRTPPPLSPIERRAFRELAQELTARLRGSSTHAENAADLEPAEAFEAAAAPSEAQAFEWPLLDLIPIGILLYRHDSLLYANRHFLEWSGYQSLDAIEAAGGVHRLFAGSTAASATDNAVQTFSIRTAGGYDLPAEGRMFTVSWQGAHALALILTSGQAEAALKQMERSLAAAESESRDIKSILDATPDGVVTLDRQGVIATANARAAALFGGTADDLTGRSLGDLLAPESARVAREYLERTVDGANGNDNAIEVAARLSESRSMPLALTLTRIGKDRFVALLHDTTARRQSEDELRNAKREAAKATAAKNEFLTKVNHEIRTPLNVITGFAEVIVAERFGPIGNERYGEYIKDIYTAGTHLVALLNDLVDLSRVENGNTELNFANISLNALTQQCVGIMQPQANKARIIIRTALTPALPDVVADERSMRQIVLNLLSNSIRLTGPGGQVIVSTVFSDAHEAVLRVRDTGAGMSEKDIQEAMEPFQETATSGSFGSGGTGFGLPLTKAIAEANRANFSITSAPNAGTLVEIAFPPSRVVAE
jgi:PAS domain S-box-containing protein